MKDPEMVPGGKLSEIHMHKWQGEQEIDPDGKPGRIFWTCACGARR